MFKSRGHELIEKPGISKEDLMACIGEFDGLVVRSATKVTKDVIDAGTRLKLIGRAGTGVDNIDCKHATTRGIILKVQLIFSTVCRNTRCKYSWRKHGLDRGASGISHSCFSPEYSSGNCFS